MAKNTKSICSIFAGVCAPSVIFRANASDLIRIMTNDANVVSLDPREYCSRNISVYDCAITSWLIIMASQCDTNSLMISSLTTYMVDDMKRYGLFPIIDYCTHLSNLIISCTENPQLVGAVLADDKWGGYSSPIWGSYLSLVDMSNGDNIRNVAQVLRYLKRYSPDSTEKLEKETISSFLYIDKGLYFRNKYLFPRPSAKIEWDIPGVNGVKPVFCEEILALAKGEVFSIMTYYSKRDPYFSSGNIADGNRPKGSKYRAALATEPSVLQHPLLDSGCIYSDFTINTRQPYLKSASFTTVNKAYNKRRPIAVEEAGRAWHMQGMRLGLRKAFHAATPCDLDDQTVNQILAKKGSITGGLATIDLSAASDHVSDELVRALFACSRDFLREYDKWRADSVTIKEKRYFMHKALTSGSPLCFEVESIVFWSLTTAAMRYFAPLLGISSQKLSADLRFNTRVYGDDIIVPSWAAEVVIQTLEYFGFEINSDKTHYLEGDPYRESCGKEYVHGCDITTMYFPRKTLRFVSSTNNVVAEDVESLCALQHRLITANMVVASTFITECIRKLIPDMTESFIGSQYSDIWAANPKTTYSKILSENLQRDVPVHYALVAKYSCKDHLIPYGEALAYEEWLRQPPISRLTVESPSTGDFLGLLNYSTGTQHDISTYCAPAKMRFIKVPDYNE